MDKNFNLYREDLFYRHCKGMTTPDENREVEQLIAQSPLLEEELEKVKETVIIQQKLGKTVPFDSFAGFQKVKNKLAAKSKPQRRFNLLFRVAASIAIPLLISTTALTFLWMKEKKANDPVSLVEIASAPGLVSNIKLPDGSTAWINAESTLQYPTGFTKGVRKVILDGEGYFDVESDKNNPFIVATRSGIEIVAHGTQFNVRTGEKKIETTLVEGKVNIQLHNQILYQLSPSEQAVFHLSDKELTVSPVNTYEKTAWKDGKIVFRNAPIHEVLERLAERFNIDIVLHDPENQADQYHSRVTFTHETIEQIFNYLKIAAPIEWKISDIEQQSDTSFTKQRIDVWIKNKPQN